MAALEDASVHQDIGPFTDFLAELLRDGLAGRSAAALQRVTLHMLKRAAAAVGMRLDLELHRS